MWARAVDEHESVTVISDSLIESESVSTVEAHPFSETIPVVGVHGIIKDGDELLASKFTENHERNE